MESIILWTLLAIMPGGDVAGSETFETRMECAARADEITQLVLLHGLPARVSDCAELTYRVPKASL